MPVLSWYWNRLRAMEPGEVSRHLRRRVWQVRHAEPVHCDGLSSTNNRAFPQLPDPASAPESLREPLRTEASDILAGRWSVFGGLQLRVDDPPHWHKDYLSVIDVPTRRSARQLNHRELPQGA